MMIYKTLNILIVPILLAGCSNYSQLDDKLSILKTTTFNCEVLKVDSATRFLCTPPSKQVEKVRLRNIEIIEGKEQDALNYTKSVLRRGTVVKIESTGQGRDKEGYIIGNVYMYGQKKLNLLLIQEGYAREQLEDKN